MNTCICEVSEIDHFKQINWNWKLDHPWCPQILLGVTLRCTWYYFIMNNSVVTLFFALVSNCSINARFDSLKMPNIGYVYV